LAYHTAWLKVHHTVEFFCANMTVEMDNTDKLKVLFEDAVKMGLTFEPPHINRGGYRFEPVSNAVIRYGLGAVRGTGQQAIESIVAARHAGGDFSSLFDFCVRIDRTRVNKRSVEALIKAGAFDDLDLNRASLVASIDRAFDFAASVQAHAHQSGLFDSADSQALGSSTREPDMVAVTPWGVKQRLSEEKVALGFFLSGHLFDEVQAEVRQFVKRRMDEVGDSREPQILCGIVSDFRTINGQRGKVALFKLDDKSAIMEASMDDALYQASRQWVKDDEFIVVLTKVQPDRFSGGLRLNVQQVWGLPQARCRFGKYLRVVVNGKEPDIDRLIRDHPPQKVTTDEGEFLRALPVRLRLLRDRAQADIELGEAARFFPSDGALASWSAHAHQGLASIVYD
jgi:DNA polymerase-3 subunit alpha